MKAGRANRTYTVISVDEDLNVIDVAINEDSDISIDQIEGDELEVWKEREDGFIFVYCNRLEIGYWVIPTLINL